MAYLQTKITWLDKRHVVSGQHSLPTGESVQAIEPLYYDRLKERLWEINAEVIENPYRREYRAIIEWSVKGVVRKLRKKFNTEEQAKKWVESHIREQLRQMAHATPDNK